MMNDLVSIITVSFNCVNSIERTILSVINQSYKNFEYIIIDGNSKDGTVDIIRKYEKYITYWISESDKGVYDAMNKGIKLAKGKWINFMNAGDIFYDSEVLKNIFENNIDLCNYSVLYGNTEFVYSNNKIIVKDINDEHHKIMPACHQSIFCLSNILKEYLFDTKYRIAADFDFFYKLYKEGHKYLYVDYIVASYEASNGMSSVQKMLCYKEILKIRETNRFIYYISIIKFKLKSVIKKIIKR